jgi:phosphoglycerate dehydrogenase-like enzyme
VNEAEMIDRLQRKVIAGAALDTFIEEPLSPDSPLWGMDNVIITPHIGGKSESYVDQIMPLLAHNFRAFQNGKMDDFRNLVPR